MTIRGDILTQAKALTDGDRNEAYGDPWENLTDCGGLWTAYLIGKFRGRTVDELNVLLDAEDVAHFNVLQKMARTFAPGYRADTYVDQAAYSAIAGECRRIEVELSEE